MQARGKQTDLLFPERSLSYAKIMQARGKQAGLLFPERSLSYAKIQHFIASTKCLAIFRSGNTKKLVHDAEANANTWHGGKAESTYPHTGSSSRNSLGTTANHQTRHATIGLATAHRCKIGLPPGPVLQPTGPQLIARQSETDCKTAPTGMQNGRYWPVKRAVWQCKTASTPTRPALCKHISPLLPACHGHAAKPLPYGCRSPAMARNDCLKKTF